MGGGDGVELFVIAVLLVFDIVLLIQLCFAVSNLRNEVEYLASEIQTRDAMKHDHTLHTILDKMCTYHSATMDSLAEMYKDVVRKGVSEGKVVGQASEDSPEHH